MPCTTCMAFFKKSKSTKMKKNIILQLPLFLALVLFGCQNSQTVPVPNPSKMDWFADAKLGIFIHWGMYSLGHESESWSFYYNRISHADYLAQADSFSAANYDPNQWAALIKASGARYAVVTSKHHDGMALWDTKQNQLSTKHITPAARDVLTPFVDALRKNQIKVGLYYSLLDWTSDDYPVFRSDSTRYKIADEPERWARFMKFCNAQIDELTELYHPDLYWFDGDWEHTAKEWKADEIRQRILRQNPNAIINGRLSGYGDYDTPEQNFPITRPNLKHWELCMTIGRSWGYRTADTIYKTPYELISILSDAIGMGGNLLLAITPKIDGTIPAGQIEILNQLGEWTTKHSEAIYGTVGGLPAGHFYGTSTLSKDSTKLYLFLPAHTYGQVQVKGLGARIKRITVVGKDIELTHKIVGEITWSGVPGLLYIDVPQQVMDKYMTVLKLELEQPPKLYRGKGGFN